MVKMYTLDNKLLTNVPEVKIGEETFPVDDRKSTVDNILDLYNENEYLNRKEAMQRMDEALELALGKKAVQKIKNMKIDDRELSWSAYNEIFGLVLAAATGEDPKAVKDRFQQGEQEQ